MTEWLSFALALSLSLSHIASLLQIHQRTCEPAGAKSHKLWPKWSARGSSASDAAAAKHHAARLSFFLRII
jgi:hypothetical protein